MAYLHNFLRQDVSMFGKRYNIRFLCMLFSDVAIEMHAEEQFCARGQYRKP